jgi:ADP-ribosylglycohydrolase
MFIEAAIGDAFGGGFEYVSAKIVKEYGDKLEYRRHPRHAGIKDGSYTDDTQMALAIAEAMLENDPWTPRTLSKRFVDVFKRDERTGYSRGFYDVLTNVKDGNELLQVVDGNSDRSGGAMRAWPIGLYSQIPEVISKATIQASITHCSTLGIHAAIASALTTHYFCYKLGQKADLGAFINRYAIHHEDLGEGAWASPYVGKVGAQGWMSVKAAITALIASNKMSELLTKCIQFTGDVDTVACIALAAGSLSVEIEQDLPQTLYDGLENGPYGKEYIVELDKRLFSRVKRP